jgi:hypothetical protein
MNIRSYSFLHFNWATSKFKRTELAVSSTYAVAVPPHASRNGRPVGYSTPPVRADRVAPRCSVHEIRSIGRLAADWLKLAEDIERRDRTRRSD